MFILYYNSDTAMQCANRYFLSDCNINTVGDSENSENVLTIFEILNLYKGHGHENCILQVYDVITA